MDYLGTTERQTFSHRCYRSLLREEPEDKPPPFSGTTIDIEHEKKVDLGVLRGAGHDGRVHVSPFSTVERVYVKFKVTVKL
eukprot:555418-Prymnesium_polylepis.1